MYMNAITLLALVSTSIASPVPDAIMAISESATIVNVASSSYSSLIVSNPTATPTSSAVEGDTLITPSGVIVPEPSATLSFQGNISSSISSSGIASESGVRVVGNTNATSSENAQTDQDQQNSGRGLRMSEYGWIGLVGVGLGMGMIL